MRFFSAACEPRVMRPGEAVREALLRQWDLVAAAAQIAPPEAPTRVRGWTNREVLAHLALQPPLLIKFLAAEDEPAIGSPAMSVQTNLSGTGRLAHRIDSAAVAGAAAGRTDFGAAARRAAPVLRSADLDRQIVSVQGPIRLQDYLVTRCVEAVVHGFDLSPPSPADEEALVVASEALLSTLELAHPELAATARALPPEVWVDVATGRAPAPAGLGAAVPVMT
jgi:hypothetical protein